MEIFETEDLSSKCTGPLPPVMMAVLSPSGDGVPSAEVL